MYYRLSAFAESGRAKDSLPRQLSFLLLCRSFFITQARIFSKPDCDSGWDSHREKYFNGYHLYMFNTPIIKQTIFVLTIVNGRALHQRHVDHHLLKVEKFPRALLKIAACVVDLFSGA